MARLDRTLSPVEQLTVVQVVAEDDGPGIPAEQREAVFGVAALFTELFQQCRRQVP